VLVLQFLASTPTWAQQGDARLTVVLGEEGGQQGSPDTGLLLKRALPVLWDRIVPLAQRRSADALGADSRMVARIVPGHQETVVQFHGERVFETLHMAHIAAIVTPPRFHLLISVRNGIGQDMQQTSSLLEEAAASLASEYGIELTDKGAGMVMAWRWLDDLHAELSVRGQSRLGEFVETRKITNADPLPKLQQWLKDVLLKARDAYAYGAADNLGTQALSSDGFRLEFVVQRSSRLLEQVALEESLAHDPRVRSISPLSLSKTLQRYSLQLEGNDITWLGEWFARRGYRMDRLADGSWTVY